MENKTMKKILFCLGILCAVSFTAAAQTAEVKAKDKKVKVETHRAKTKVKKTTTPGQKVHNLLHPKRKKYSGVKVKHEVKKEG
jgi:opacity protein-like surface antigen